MNPEERARLSEQMKEFEKTTASFMKKAKVAGITAQELRAVIDANFVRAILDSPAMKAEGKQDWYQDIIDFHKATDSFIGSRPAMPSLEVYRLRKALVKEEVTEVLEAMSQDDLIGLADGIADSIVVLLGTAVSYGIDIRPVWDEVHKTNMAKAGGPRRIDGKILKPKDWKPPDVRAILVEQGMEEL